MCIACEMDFWMAIEGLSAVPRRKSAEGEATSFVCKVSEPSIEKSVKRRMVSKPRQRSTPTNSKRRP